MTEATKPKVKKLTRLQIHEVSAVDRGAGDGVRVMLAKNDPATAATIAKREAKIDAYMKREFSTEQRRTMAATGQAMRGGGYPIANRKDLKNAIRAIGRAKNPGKTKRHIISRARSLGATDVLPDKWVRKSLTQALGWAHDFFAKSEGGEDFATELAEMRDMHFGEGLQNAIHDASHAMKHSIESIMDDDGTPDKGDAIRESYSQFMNHLATLAPEGDVTKIAKASLEKLGTRNFDPKEFEMAGKGPIDVSPKDTPPTKPATSVGSGSDKGKNPPGVEEETDPEVNKARAKAAMWKNLYKSLRKASKDDKEWMDHPDNDADDDDVKKYLLMDSTARAAYREANPIGKLTQKRMDSLPEPLRKQLEAGQRAAEELAKRMDAEDLQTMTKRATDLAMPQAVAVEAAPHMVALRKAAPEALDKVLEHFGQVVKALGAQVDTTVIYKEFGTARGADTTGSAYDQLMSLAKNYQEDMTKVGKTVTEAQAFEKVSTDPANKALFEKSKHEGRPAA